MAGARPDTWMPLYIGDYLADTMHLSHAQHGIYMLLIMAYWRNSGPLPADNSQLAAIAKCSPSEWRKHLPVIGKFFHISRNYWEHKRIDAELASAAKNTQERSKAGSEGARKRWQPDGKDIATPLANSMTDPIANASQNDAPSPSPSPSLKLASKLISDSLPSEWGEIAAAERTKAGLPEVDLRHEWERFISKIGTEPTVERWLGWALKARVVPADSPAGKPQNGGGELPEMPWPQRCRGWAKGQRWHPDWGPPPDAPGCWAPQEMIDQALRQRHTNSAASPA